MAVYNKSHAIMGGVLVGLGYFLQGRNEKESLPDAMAMILLAENKPLARNTIKAKGRNSYDRFKNIMGAKVKMLSPHFKNKYAKENRLPSLTNGGTTRYWQAYVDGWREMENAKVKDMGDVIGLGFKPENAFSVNEYWGRIDGAEAYLDWRSGKKDTSGYSSKAYFIPTEEYDVMNAESFDADHCQECGCKEGPYSDTKLVACQGCHELACQHCLKGDKSSCKFCFKGMSAENFNTEQYLEDIDFKRGQEIKLGSLVSQGYGGNYKLKPIKGGVRGMEYKSGELGFLPSMKTSDIWFAVSEWEHDNVRMNAVRGKFVQYSDEDYITMGATLSYNGYKKQYHVESIDGYVTTQSGDTFGSDYYFYRNERGIYPVISLENTRYDFVGDVTYAAETFDAEMIDVETNAINIPCVIDGQEAILTNHPEGDAGLVFYFPTEDFVFDDDDLEQKGDTWSEKMKRLTKDMDRVLKENNIPHHKGIGVDYDAIYLRKVIDELGVDMIEWDEEKGDLMLTLELNDGEDKQYAYISTPLKRDDFINHKNAETLSAEYGAERIQYCSCDMPKPRHVGVHPTVCSGCDMVITEDFYEDWSGDSKGQLGQALAKARKNAKKPTKPLKIERLDAESYRIDGVNDETIYILKQMDENKEKGYLVGNEHYIREALNEPYYYSMDALYDDEEKHEKMLEAYETMSIEKICETLGVPLVFSRKGGFYFTSIQGDANIHVPDYVENRAESFGAEAEGGLLYSKNEMPAGKRHYVWSLDSDEAGRYQVRIVGDDMTPAIPMKYFERAWEGSGPSDRKNPSQNRFGEPKEGKYSPHILDFKYPKYMRKSNDPLKKGLKHQISIDANEWDWERFSRENPKLLRKLQNKDGQFFYMFANFDPSHYMYKGA